VKKWKGGGEKWGENASGKGAEKNKQRWGGEKNSSKEQANGDTTQMPQCPCEKESIGKKIYQKNLLRALGGGRVTWKKKGTFIRHKKRAKKDDIVGFWLREPSERRGKKGDGKFGNNGRKKENNVEERCLEWGRHLSPTKLTCKDARGTPSAKCGGNISRAQKAMGGGGGGGKKKKVSGMNRWNTVGGNFRASVNPWEAKKRKNWDVQELVCKEKRKNGERELALIKRVLWPVSWAAQKRNTRQKSGWRKRGGK